MLLAEHFPEVQAQRLLQLGAGSGGSLGVLQGLQIELEGDALFFG
jgi:hypothetical protein